MNITDFIPIGRNSAIKRSELVKVTRMSDRAVRQLIETERLKGMPIINIGNGYYIADANDPSDVLEVCDYCNAMRGRARALTAEHRALSEWLGAVEEVLNV